VPNGTLREKKVEVLAIQTPHPGSEIFPEYFGKELGILSVTSKTRMTLRQAHLGSQGCGWV